MTGASFISDDLVDDLFLSNRAYIAGWYKFNYKVDKCELPFCINFCFGDREFFCGRLWQSWAQSGNISQTFFILSLNIGQDNALTQSISHNFEAQPCISAIENIVFRNFVRPCLIPVTKGRVPLPNRMNFWNISKGEGGGGGSFSIQKFMLQIFAIIDNTSVMNFGKNLQHNFPKMRSKAVWNFSKNLSVLEL